MNGVYKISDSDNVAVALQDIAKGTPLNDLGLVAAQDIPMAHKIALQDIAVGEVVTKYGYSIGHATHFIARGTLVHTHNVRTALNAENDYTYKKESVATDPMDDDYFFGYIRNDGSVGIRNEVWIIPTVGCVNSVVNAIAKACSGTADVIVPFNHPYGCSQLGDDQENTRKVLASLVNHPNAAGVLLVGLGCENSNIEVLKGYIKDTSRVLFLECQSEGGAEVAVGVSYVNKLVSDAKLLKRKKVPYSKLTIGLKCGGSDGLSGITANPLVGAFADKFIAKGGNILLTEIPEMFGAETVLLNRCKNIEIFNKLVALINNFKASFTANNLPIYENPSPGNKNGGITTLEDKSLGCILKAGNSEVVDVLDYAQKQVAQGLTIINAPGNDVVAATAEVVAGAQLILFTTGRGTPFGAPVPTVKISSNTAVYDKIPCWFDFNAGTLAMGNATIDTLSSELYKYVKYVADGKLTHNELNGYRDMAIWKKGETL